MAPQMKLEGPRITRKGDTSSQIAPPPPKMVDGGRQCAPRSTITPTKTCSAVIYRRIKRRLGRSLKRSHCKGNLVTSRKQATRKLPGTKSGLSGPKRVPRPLPEQHSSYSHRQHHSGCIHKQRRRDEIGPSVCPSVENHDLVYQQTGYFQSLTHSRLAECGSRQAIQARPDNSTERSLLPEVFRQYAKGGTNLRPLCDKVQQLTRQICVKSAGPPGLGSLCTQPAIGGSGPICLPTSNHLGQSGGEVGGLPLQENHSDCSRVAPYTLVLGSSGHVQPNPTEPAQPAHTFSQTPHRNVSNLNLNVWLLEPQQSRSRASLRQW